jgi:hypothetical protein
LTKVKVVDLWGVRNKSTGKPWEEDSMVVVYGGGVGTARASRSAS